MALAVGSAAVSVTSTAVGLAANVAVGSAKLVGKGVGAAMDAMAEDPDVEPAPGIMETDSDHPSESPLDPCQQPSCLTTTQAW